MDRNRLKEEDRINEILNVAGMKFAQLLKWEADFMFHFLLAISFSNGLVCSAHNLNMGFLN